MTDLTLYDMYGVQHNCVQLNYGINVTKSVKSTREGRLNCYYMIAYIPSDSGYFRFDITDNSDQVVSENIYKEVYPGQSTEITLSKTRQTTLGKQQSDCIETKHYRQVNCIDDCFNTKMSKTCGCSYPTECGDFAGWTEDCMDAID